MYQIIMLQPKTSMLCELYQFKKIKKNSYLLCSYFPFPPYSCHPPICFQFLIYLLCIFHINGIIQHMNFCDRLLPLNIFKVHPHCSISSILLLFMAGLYFIVCTYQNLINSYLHKYLW